MILTGKCKEDFLIKIYYKEDTNQASDESNKELLIFHSNKWLERQDDRLIQSLIIEFFDSVGIYCYFDCQWSSKDNIWWRLHISSKNINSNIVIGDFNNRQEAMNSAIGKANEIYNHLNKD